MSKRARNDGAEPRAVFDPKDERGVYAQPIDVVEPGKLLTADAPQRIHDDVGRMDGWTLVDYAAPGTKKDEKEGDR